MNKIYRLIMNRDTGQMSVAHEMAKSHGSRSSTVKKTILAAAVAAAISGSGAVLAYHIAWDTSYGNYVSSGGASGYVVSQYHDGGFGNAVVSVYDNTIITTGAINTTDIVGLGIVSRIYTNGYAKAYAEYNTITNSHAITQTGTSGGGAGIGIGTYAQSYGSSAFAYTVDNTILNNKNGTINSSANYASGIIIGAYANANSNYSAMAEVNGNTITNKANITLTGNNTTGIEIYAYSTARSVDSHADVLNNVITNSGNITLTNGGVGINVHAFSYGEDSSTAHVLGNTIQNSGNISASYAGIALLARSINNYNNSYADVSGNTITNSGKIVAVEDGIVLGAYAGGNWYYNQAQDLAYAQVINNHVTNSGTISTTGRGINLYAESYSNNYDDSVAIVSNNEIVNSGKIITTGQEGINLNSSAYMRDNNDAIAHTSENKIVNTGSISSNFDAIRINASAYSYYNSTKAYSENNKVYNSGKIVSADGSGISLRANAYSAYSTYGENGSIATASDNLIVNNGSIKASGFDGILVEANANSYSGYAGAFVNNNTIINHGSITAVHDGIHLVTSAVSYNAGSYDMMRNNTITNTGSIVVGNHGIHLDADYYVRNNTINNSGKVVSTGTYDGGSGPGSSDAQAIKIDGSVSYSDFPHNTNQFDNTLNLSAPGFIGGRILLSQYAHVNVNLTSGVSHSVHWTIEEGDGRGAKSVSTAGSHPWFSRNGNEFSTIDPTGFANAPSQIADTTRMVSAMAKFGLDKDLTDGKSNTWLNVQGDKSMYEGNQTTTQRQVNRLYGISGGYSAKYDDKTVLGAMVGYNRNELNVTGRWAKSYDNTTDGAFVGVFGRTKAADNLSIDYALHAGFNSHDDDRFVNDNLYGLGNSHAKSSYDSYWIAPEATVSLPFEVASGLTLAPSWNIRFTQQHLDSYTESGSDSNARVSSRDIGMAETKLGFGVTQKWGMGSVGASVGYLYRDLVSGDESVSVSMLNNTHNINFDYRKLSAGVLGLDAKINLSKDVVFQATGNYINGTTVNGGNVMGSIKFAF